MGTLTGVDAKNGKVYGGSGGVDKYMYCKLGQLQYGMVIGIYLGTLYAENGKLYVGSGDMDKQIHKYIYCKLGAVAAWKGNCNFLYW